MEIIKSKRVLIPDKNRPIDTLDILSLAATMKVPIWNSEIQSVIKDFSLDDYTTSELHKLFRNEKLFYTKIDLGIIL